VEETADSGSFDGAPGRTHVFDGWRQSRLISNSDTVRVLGLNFGAKDCSGIANA